MATTTDSRDFPSMYSDIGAKYEEAFAHDAGLIKFTASTIPLLPPNAYIFDVGCGTGRPVAAMLSEAGHRILGIDISSTMVSLSQTAVPTGVFETGDMRTWTPSPSGTPNFSGFDAVFNILSLFILNRDEIESMAAKWAAWVKPNGLLCICTMAAEDLRPKSEHPQAYDADGYCARDIMLRFMGQNLPVTLFTRDGWKWLLKKVGFEVVSEMMEVHTPPPEADSDVEPHYYVVARKI